MKTPTDKIPLMRPLLFSHEYALPYLREIDKNRWYSNFGPMVQSLESRLAELFGLGEGGVVTTSNGTAALVNILRAMDLPKGTFCLVPSWTFIATPASIVAAGLTPYFIDVDEATWAITPENAKRYVEMLGSAVSVVMAVAPYGSPLNTAEWDAFTEETGIPVIIDAAACFDAFSTVPSARPGKTPVMISMHATKSFGIGEGGMVASTNTKLMKRIQEMSNFGFTAERQVAVPGTNGKMSEFSAAYAHTALDLWPQMREYWLGKKWYYAKAFEEIAPVATHPWLHEDWASSSFSVRVADGKGQEVIEALNANGIESRCWWGRGCHAQVAYSKFPHAPLPVTEKLASSVLALPFTLDIGQEDVDYIMKTLERICLGPTAQAVAS